MMATSADGGHSWSTGRRLPRGILGPIKNKPVQLADGTLLCPSSTEHLGWRCHLERTSDLGATWRRQRPLNRRWFGAIQPCILHYPGGLMQILCRTRRGVIGECWSSDRGSTWSRMRATDLPNPDSGIDAVVLADGRALLAYNHTRHGRTPLNLAVSHDGRAWRPSHVLEDAPGEHSYPAVIQGQDGMIHITYTWNRCRILYVSLAPDEL